MVAGGGKRLKAKGGKLKGEGVGQNSSNFGNRAGLLGISD
jgi:hypothetical protein